MQRTPTCQNCCQNFVYKDSFKPNFQRIPLLLKCGHTFCEACINKWARQLKTHVTCPECEVVSSVTEGEWPVKCISPNLYQLGILTANRKTALESDYKKPRKRIVPGKIVQKALSQFSNQRKAAQLKAEEGKATLKCEECFLAVATSRCPKCANVFCEVCFEKVHSSSNILRKHKPVPLSSTSDVTPGCPKHDNRPFEYYDKTTSQPVCSHCVVIGDRQDHEIVPSSDVTANLQDEFKLSLEASKKILSHLQKSEKKICNCLPQLNMEKSQLVNGIREHFQNLHAALQIREELLIEEVEENAEDKNSVEAVRQTIAENIKKASSYIQEVEYILDDPLKLIAKTKQLSEQLEEIQEIPCCAVKVDSDQDTERITYDEKLQNLIASYGTLTTYGKNRFTMKKISDVTEDDISDTDEQSPKEDSESKLIKDGLDTEDEVTNHIPRSLIASKLLHVPYRHELVQVTHIVDPCHFFVQRIADVEQLNLIMNAINVICEHSDDTSDLFFEVQVGQVCCCQFSDDNQWYRARVVSVHSPSNPLQFPTLENGLPVEVMYIDYGNNEWVPLSRLRKMPDKFLEVTELAVACSLTDIVPPFEEQKWPSKSIKLFGSVTNKPQLMTVSDRIGGKLYVDLRKPDDDEPTKDDDRPSSVRDYMVFLQVARFLSPASRPVPGGQVFVPSKYFKEPAPLEKDCYLDVLVSHVVSPEEIYLLRLQSEEVNELDRIMKEMTHMYTASRSRENLKIEYPYRDLVCAARFSQDKSWYRALVTAINSDDTVEVSYVDFGNSERLPLSDIRKLLDMFLHLPKQATCTRMADVKPCDQSTEWPEEVKSRLATILTNKKLVARVVECVDDRNSVLLYDTSNAFDVCINELMVKKGLAEHSGLGLVKTLEELLESEGTETTSQDEVEKEVIEGAATSEEVVVSQIPEKDDPSPQSFRDYLPPELPKGKRFVLEVTYIDDNGFIYGQDLIDGNRTLIGFMSELQKMELNDIPDNNFRLAPKLPCCALYEDDGMWYRARVENLCQDGKVRVNYVDFGNSEAVNLEALRLETPFMHIPQQCLQLVLHGIEPNTPDGQWPTEGLNLLNQLIVGTECVANIESERISGCPFLVVNLALPNGMDVSSLMLSKGIGRQCSPKKPSEDSRKNKKERTAKKEKKPLDLKSQAKAITTREVNNMLSHTHLPGEGVEFDVTITQIDQPNFVYIQRVPPLGDEDGLALDDDPTLEVAAAELYQLELMAQRINQPDYFKNLLPLTTAWIGMLCCGQYSQDDMWYRAEVLSVECEKPLECHVLFIDYGTSEVLKGESLRGFPSILLELPKQAVRCRLGDIHPPENFEGPLIENTLWPRDSMETLIELVAGKKLVAKILSHGPPISIVLFERVSHEDGTIQDISIGQQLAEEKLARYFEPIRDAVNGSEEVTTDKDTFASATVELSDVGADESLKAITKSTTGSVYKESSGTIIEESTVIFHEKSSNIFNEESTDKVVEEEAGPGIVQDKEVEKDKVFEFPDDEARLPFFQEETKHNSAGAEAAAAILEKILAPPPKVAFSSTPGTKLLTPSQIISKKASPRSESPRRISANIGLQSAKEGKIHSTAPPSGGKESSTATTPSREEKTNVILEKPLEETSGNTSTSNTSELGNVENMATSEGDKNTPSTKHQVSTDVAEEVDEVEKTLQDDQRVNETETSTSDQSSNTVNVNEHPMESSV